MKFVSKLILSLMLSSAAFAQPVINCVDGTRSMKVENRDGELVGRLDDFRLKLNNMKCHTIPNTKTLRCEQNEYYVVFFKIAQTQKLTAQVNLRGDFGSDSGYLHSLSCQ